MAHIFHYLRAIMIFVQPLALIIPNHLVCLQMVEEIPPRWCNEESILMTVIHIEEQMLSFILFIQNSGVILVEVFFYIKNNVKPYVMLRLRLGSQCVRCQTPDSLRLWVWWDPHYPNTHTHSVSRAVWWPWNMAGHCREVIQRNVNNHFGGEEWNSSCALIENGGIHDTLWVFS